MRSLALVEMMAREWKKAAVILGGVGVQPLPLVEVSFVQWKWKAYEMFMNAKWNAALITWNDNERMSNAHIVSMCSHPFGQLPFHSAFTYLFGAIWDGPAWEVKKLHVFRKLETP